MKQIVQTLHWYNMLLDIL